MTESHLPENIRRLSADDLGRVIEIDMAFADRRRQGFFEKRVAAATAEPEAFVYIGYQPGDVLEGYALARILDGEFGGSERVATLDGLAVDAALIGKGLGRKLMFGLEQVLRDKGVKEIQTQADWTNFSLLRFLSYWGFNLAPRIVLERGCAVPPGSEDAEIPPRDRITPRSITQGDLPALIRIAEKNTGLDQTAYLERKLSDALNESGVRVSLVAEVDDHVVAYIMARVDFGEFGKTEPTAVIDTIGVDPGYSHREVGSALLSQLLLNLETLHIERVRTEVRSDQFELLSFLDHNGFRPSQVLALSRSLI